MSHLLNEALPHAKKVIIKNGFKKRKFNAKLCLRLCLTIPLPNPSENEFQSSFVLVVYIVITNYFPKITVLYLQPLLPTLI